MDDYSVRHDSDAGEYSLEFSADGEEPVSDALVYAVSTVLDEDPTALTPLGEVVEVDAINALFGHSSDASRDVRLSFEYEGFLVTISGRGEITLEEW